MGRAGAKHEGQKGSVREGESRRVDRVGMGGTLLQSTYTLQKCCNPLIDHYKIYSYLLVHWN